MFSRYINLPEKTAVEFSGAFFKTGDIAARERVGDDEVHFKILGRASMVAPQHAPRGVERRRADDRDDAPRRISSKAVVTKFRLLKLSV